MNRSFLLLPLLVACGGDGQLGPADALVLSFTISGGEFASPTTVEVTGPVGNLFYIDDTEWSLVWLPDAPVVATDSDARTEKITMGGPSTPGSYGVEDYQFQFNIDNITGITGTLSFIPEDGDSNPVDGTLEITRRQGELLTGTFDFGAHASPFENTEPRYTIVGEFQIPYSSSSVTED